MPGLDDLSLTELESLRVQRLTLDGFPGARITSTLRTPEHNAKVGGVRNSQHLDNQAIDFAGVSGVTSDQARAYYASHGVTLTEAKNEGDHMHVGWRPKAGLAPASDLDNMSLEQLQALRAQVAGQEPAKPAPKTPPPIPRTGPITTTDLITGRTSRPPTKAEADARARNAVLDKRDGADSRDRNRALAEGAFFGFGDELQGAKAAVGTGLRNMIGRGPGYSAREAYDATRGEEEARLAAFRKAHPFQAAANTIGGAIVNPANLVGGEFVGAARGGQQVARAALVGGTVGATQGAGSAQPGQRLEGALKGGATGAAVGAVLQGGGNVLAARSARRVANPSAARQLSQAGVQLTPGQMAGGLAKRVEDAATSFPITGMAINGARRRGMETFNRAAINEALAPIGAQLPRRANVGREGVQAAQTAISDAYTQALSRVPSLAPDAQYAQDLAHIAATPNLPAAVRAELDTMLADVQGQFAGPVTGQVWKNIDSQIGRAAQAADNASGQTPSMGRLANTLRDMRRAHQGVLERAAPDVAEAVRAADLASANFARVRQASQYVGTAAREGVFTPADLNRAVQGLDNSANNRSYAGGDALGQQLSQNGQVVLPSSIPDSGSALRGMLGLGAYGGVAGLGGPSAAVKAVIADLTVASLYTPPVQAAVNAIYRATSPGQASGALAQLAQLAARNPGLAPLYNELREQITGPASGRALSSLPQGQSIPSSAPRIPARQ